MRAECVSVRAECFCVKRRTKKSRRNCVGDLMAARAYWQDHGDIIGWSAPGHSSAAGVSLVSARQRQQPAADDPYAGSTSLRLHKDTFAFQSGTEPHTPGLAAPRQRQPAVPYAGSPSALVSKDDTLFESPDCRRQLKWVAPATPEAAAGLTTRAVNDELTNIYTPKMKRQLSAVSRDGIPLSWHARQPGWDALGVLPSTYAEAAKLRF